MIGTEIHPASYKRMGCCVPLLAALVLGAELAVATAVSIQPDVDPRSFGAVGNGGIDDAPALQAAPDACPQGSVLRLPKGRWLLQSQTSRLRSGVTLHGVGQDSVLVKSAKLTTALGAVNASNIVVTGVWFAVEASAPAVMEGRLAHFRHCRQVTVRQCSFDGNATNGLPSQFSLCLFECCNDVKCLDNCFSNAAGSATGVTGASWEPGWGHGSEFARNVIEDYCDTGIGLWTGARDAHLHHNRLKGRREKFTSFPVGTDASGFTTVMTASIQ